MSERGFIVTIEVYVTRTAMLELEREARERGLQVEDVAGEAIDQHARERAGLPARFAQALRDYETKHGAA